jgi:Domain of unknown function (DUF4276)
MVTEIRIYFEGNDALRSGFRVFLDQIAEASRSRKWRFNLIATNGTPVPDYHDAVKTHPRAWNVLLLDSEGAITESPADLCAKKGLAGLSDRVFWMVQMMESWFLADPEKLKEYYGQDFKEDVLRGNPNVEQISKGDVKARLLAATRKTKAGKYHKTSHAPHLLSRIRPDLVKAAAPNCQRLFDALLTKLAED